MEDVRNLWPSEEAARAQRQSQGQRQGFGSCLYRDWRCRKMITFPHKDVCGKRDCAFSLTL